MDRIDDRYVQAFCPRCRLLRPTDCVSCECGAPVPIAHGRDGGEVMLTVDRHFQDGGASLPAYLTSPRNSPEARS